MEEAVQRHNEETGHKKTTFWWFSSFKKLKKWRAKGLLKQLLSSPLHLVDIVEFLPAPKYKVQSVLKEKYVEKGMSIRQIAKESASSKETVRAALKKTGIEAREPCNHHGRPAQARYGTKYLRDFLEDHRGEQRVIKAILDMRDQGVSLRKICQFLSQIGVPTKCRGRKWHPEMVNRIIKANYSDGSKSKT